MYALALPDQSDGASCVEVPLSVNIQCVADIFHRFYIAEIAPIFDRFAIDIDPPTIHIPEIMPSIWSVIFCSEAQVIEKDIQIPVKLCIEHLNELKAEGKPFEYVLFPELGHNTAFANTTEPIDISIEWIKQQTE